MNGYDKCIDRSKTLEKHRVIYQQYLQLRRNKLENHPIEAKYLGVSYYADVIAQEPLIGLKPQAIVRIINSFIKGRRK